MRETIVMTRINRKSASTPPDVKVTRLPPSTRDLLLYEAALQTSRSAGEDNALLTHVRREAARHGGDPYARRVLAHAELLHGDRRAAEAILHELVTASPNEGELLYLMGMVHLLNAEEADDPVPVLRQAQAWFGRAHKADPDHFQTLFRYARSMREEERYVSENTSNILLLAHQLAPQVSTVRFEAASMLMMRKQWDDAIHLLSPLANHPHDSGAASSAQEMIKAAQEQKEL